MLRRAKNIKSADEPERDRLLTDAERLETWSAWLVLGAIVLEVIVWAYPFSPPLFRFGNFAADAAVAIGIYGEMRFGHVVGDILKIRLAEAIERAAKAELETEKLRAEFGWRSVSVLAMARLVEALSRNPGRVSITYAFGDVESATYAAQLLFAFRHSSWSADVTVFTVAFSDFGLLVPQLADKAAEPSRAVREAFTAAEIEFSGGQVPQIVGLSTMRSFPAPTGKVFERQMFELPAAQVHVGPKAMPWAAEAFEVTAMKA